MLSIERYQKTDLLVVETDYLLKAFTLMPSIRRVANIFNIDPLDITASTRIQDVQYDLSSFAGIEAGEDEIRAAIWNLEDLITSGGLMRMDERSEESLIGYEEDGLFTLRANEVRRLFWTRWKPRGTTLEANLISLQRYIEVCSLHLHQGRHSQEHTIIDARDRFEATWIEDQRDALFKDTTTPEEELLAYEAVLERAQLGSIEDDEEPHDPLAQETPPRLSPTKSLRQWANQFSLQQIMFFVSQLPTRQQAALLKEFGYIGVDETRNTYARRKGFNRKTYYLDIEAGHAQMMQIASEQQSGDFPNLDIASLVGAAEKTYPYRLNDRVLGLKSYRVQLAELGIASDPLFAAKLTPLQQRVVALLLLHDEGNFRYSTDELAEQLGLNASYLRSTVIPEIFKIAKQKTPAFVDDTGRRLSPSLNHHRLLALSPTISPLQMANLTVFQQTLFFFATSPNDEGRYPSQERFIDAGYKNRMTLIRLIHNLVSTAQIEQVQARVLTILENPSGFPEKIVQAAEQISVRLESGIPMKNAKGKFDWAGIAHKVGLTSQWIGQVFRVLDLVPF